MTTVILSSDALADLQEGFWFYEAQQEGLGDHFATCLREDVESLRNTAGIHRKTREDYHRALSRVFPYALYYTCDGEEAIVWAVVDCRRNPEWIRRLLQR